MFYSDSDKDHGDYLEANYEMFLEMPGFPFIRMNPAQNSHAFSTEQLLLVMHGRSAELLVVSNKRIVIYEIPKKKSLFRRASGVAGNIGLGMIPGVGDMLDAADSVKDVYKGARGVKRWASPGDRRENARREQEGLPSRYEGSELVWDLGKDEILAMILLYRENILLENGFHWKKKFEVALEYMVGQPSEIWVDEDGLNLNIEGEKAFFKFATRDLDFTAILAHYYLTYTHLFATAGWVMQNYDGALVLKQAFSA